MNEKINLLLADDHTIVIDGLRMILDANEKMNVVITAENGEEVLESLQHTQVDVAVLDINMPKMDGIKCAKRIKILYPSIKIIILTMYAQRSFIDEVVKIGIDGCLLKNNTGKELITAIERVYEGRSYYDMIQTFNSPAEEVKQYKLSEREIDIIKALAEGLSSSQISEKMFLSIHTVKTHRKNILKKLDLHNSSELVQYSLNKGII